jgi:hypothetical protein
MKTFILLLCFLGLSPLVYAGNDTGNGGNSVVCQNSDGTVRFAELLDLYEARVMHGILPDLGALSIPYQQKVEDALGRLERLSPLRVAKYRNWISEFERDSLLLPGVTLIEVPDSDHVALPSGCKRMQLIVQKAPQFPEDKRYTISKDIWDHLDNDSRAAAVLHEVVYREGFEENHHTNSVAARYFNSILLSKRLGTMTIQEFVSLLTALPFTDLGIRRYGVSDAFRAVTGIFISKSFGLGKPKRFEFSALPLTFSAGGTAVESVWIVNPSYDGDQALRDLGRGYMISAFGSPFRAELHPDSGLKGVYLERGIELSKGKWFEARNVIVRFNAEGRLATISPLPSGLGSRIVVDDGEVKVLHICGPTADQPAGTASFKPDGSLAKVTGHHTWGPYECK